MTLRVAPVSKMNFKPRRLPACPSTTTRKSLSKSNEIALAVSDSLSSCPCTGLARTLLIASMTHSIHLHIDPCLSRSCGMGQSGTCQRELQFTAYHPCVLTLSTANVLMTQLLRG